MADIRILCPACKTPFTASQSGASTSLACPHCAKLLRLPASPRPQPDTHTVTHQPETAPRDQPTLTHPGASAVERTIAHQAGPGDGAAQQTIAHPTATAAPAAPPASASPGAARYTIVKPHARGGLGEVFVARDAELNRDVALKQIQSHLADQEGNRARFLREAEITGRLEHPGIVPVYGLCRDEHGRPFYAMRFIEGETLKDAIARLHDTPRSDGERLFELRKLLSRFDNVCNTIAYAHSHDVLHRDLKPSNIMLGPYGETLVVDWGLAKSLSDTSPETASAADNSEPQDAAMTQQGAILGTPAYMSPEQATGRELGPASDIWSLGGTLYSLLTGAVPYRGDSVKDMLGKAARCDFVPPRQLKPWLPAALDAVCRKAMAAEPAARYGSATELSQDVQRWLADEPIAAEREAWSVRLGRWQRRHRTLVASTLVLVFSSLLAVAIGAWLLAAEEARTTREKEDKLQAEKSLTKEQERSLQEQKAKLQALSEKESVHGYVLKLLGSPDPSADARTSLGDMLQTAVTRATQDFQQEPLILAEILGQIATTFHNLGETKQAQELYRRAWTTLKEKQGPQHLQTQRMLHRLSAVLVELGQADEAVVLLTAQAVADELQDEAQALLALAYQESAQHAQALALFQQSHSKHVERFGADDPRSLRSQALLAGGQLRVGAVPLAHDLAAQAYAKLLAAVGPNHADTLQAQLVLGQALLEQGKLEPSLALLRDNFQRRELHQGKTRYGTVQTIGPLARAYLASQRLDLAVPLAERLWDYWRTNAGAKHPRSLAAWDVLADGYSRAGNVDKLQPLLEGFLQAQSAELGAANPYIVLAKTRLGLLHEHKTRLREAMPLLEEALPELRKEPARFAREIEEVQRCLLRIYQETQAEAKAESLLSALVEAARKDESANRAQLAAQLALVTQYRLQARKYAAAESACRECLAIRQEKAPEHWLLWNTKSMLGECLLGQKKYQEAEPLLLEGYEGLQARAGAMPALAQPRLSEALQRLVALYEALGQPAKVEMYRELLGSARTTAVQLFEGRLLDTDPIGHGFGSRAPYKFHEVLLRKARPYLLELCGTFDPELAILDAAGRQVFTDILRSELVQRSQHVFVPPAEGKYRLIVSIRGKTSNGHYFLRVQELTPTGAPQEGTGQLGPSSPHFAGQPTARVPVRLPKDRLSFVEIYNTDFAPHLHLLDPTGTKILTERRRHRLLQSTDALYVLFESDTEAPHFLLVGSDRRAGQGAFHYRVRSYLLGDADTETQERHARAYLHAGWFADAARLLEKAWLTRKNQQGPTAAATLRTAQLLVHALVADGRQVEALPLAREALASAEKQADPAALFTALVHVSSLAWALGSYDESVSLLERAEKTLPGQKMDETPFLAVLYDPDLPPPDAKVTAAAGAVLSRLRGWAAKELGAKHGMTHTLALAQGFHGIARGVYSDANFQGVIREQHGRETAYFLNWSHNRYFAYQKQGDRKKMDECARECLRLRLRLHGHLDLRHLQYLSDHVWLELKEQNFVKIEQDSRDLASWSSKAAPAHWLHARALAPHGAVLTGVKKYEEAEPLLLRAHEMLTARASEVPPSRRVCVAESLDWLIGLYDAWGQLDKANTWRQKKAALP